MVFLGCSDEGQIVWRENLKASYSCIVSGVAGKQWKVLGEANTCNHCIGQTNHSVSTIIWEVAILTIVDFFESPNHPDPRT